MRKVVVPVPPQAEQRRIASILSAYDDLIEVNRRRIAVLETMARGLFEVWFVRFRFPGHEDCPVAVNGDGPLPPGWMRVQLHDMLVLQRGFDLPTSSRTDGPFPVVSASGVSGNHHQCKVHGPGVLTGRSGTIGQVHLIFEDHWPLNTTLYVKEFKLAGPAFALLLLRSLELGNSSTGSAVPTLNRNHIHGLPIIAPPADLMASFEQFAITNLRAADVLRKQSTTLAAARDLLLPRLISGELSVAAAEREMEDAA